MWRKHQNVYQYYLKYIRNDVFKPLCVRILSYTDHIQEMHDLTKQLPPHFIKGESYETANCIVRYK